MVQYEAPKGTISSRLNEFRFFLEGQGYSQKTIGNTLTSVSNFPVPLDQSSFQHHIHDLIPTRRPNYINRIIMDGRLYGRFLGLEWLSKYPKLITRYKPHRPLLTDEQIETILAIRPDKKSDSVTFNKTWNDYSLALTILAYTGCRPSEALSVTQEDIDLAQSILTFRETKNGDDAREVPIVDQLRLMLDKSIQSGALMRLKQKNVKGLARNFNQRLELAGIQKKHNLTPHSLRHSFITSGANTNKGNASLRDIQAIVGHKSIETTAQYIHPDIDSKRAAIGRLPIVRKHQKKRDYLEELGEASNQIVKDLKPEEAGFKIEKVGNKLKYTYTVVVEDDKY